MTTTSQGQAEPVCLVRPKNPPGPSLRRGLQRLDEARGRLSYGFGTSDDHYPGLGSIEKDDEMPNEEGRSMPSAGPQTALRDWHEANRIWLNPLVGCVVMLAMQLLLAAAFGPQLPIPKWLPVASLIGAALGFCLAIVGAMRTDTLSAEVFIGLIKFVLGCAAAYGAIIFLLSLFHGAHG